MSTAMGRVVHPPKVFVSASAFGIYGNRGTELLTEHSAPGKGFLAEVCKEWEAASWPASPPAAGSVRLPDHRCPACGMPSAALLAPLPGGSRALIEACAVCGRQEATPVGEERACLLADGCVSPCQK